MSFPIRFVICLLAALMLAPATSAQDDPPPPCSEPEARQFDFWIGEWEVYAGDKVVGHNRISRIHGGCTLLEEYDSQPGQYEGKSFNYYDPVDGQWHQIWVDNGGTRLHLRGGFADGRMVLSGKRATAGGEVFDRISWTDNDDGTVRQVWEQSKDDGETFAVVFDGLYRPAIAAADKE